MLAAAEKKVPTDLITQTTTTLATIQIKHIT